MVLRQDIAQVQKKKTAKAMNLHQSGRLSIPELEQLCLEVAGYLYRDNLSEGSAPDGTLIASLPALKARDLHLQKALLASWLTWLAQVKLVVYSPPVRSSRDWKTLTRLAGKNCRGGNRL